MITETERAALKTVIALLDRRIAPLDAEWERLLARDLEEAHSKGRVHLVLHRDRRQVRDRRNELGTMRFVLHEIANEPRS